MDNSGKQKPFSSVIVVVLVLDGRALVVFLFDLRRKLVAWIVTFPFSPIGGNCSLVKVMKRFCIQQTLV